ncbi:SRPBCC domain-containing protein [Agromyces archimandritae]|uniref:SRPBCC domain-containing protein n=1 Tax=Agromyces archimandritae TaxID=2781962 RepID=A0A975IPA1_9MICO|nr:SRPBCC domain-containing protein [Agromyces archimandritae]QTX03771.1 SRPBCC domain-containing protein [Agromyces archimandritae]
MRIVETVDIDAAPEAVWRVLTEFGEYASWNPFIVACASTLVPGDPIDMHVRLGPGEPREQREWITSYAAGAGFAYSMKPIPFGALRSHRSHEIVPLGDGRSRYTSRFEVHGWLAPLVVAMQGAALRRGFAGMTDGLRRRAETLAAGEG